VLWEAFGGFDFRHDLDEAIVRLVVDAVTGGLMVVWFLPVGAGAYCFVVHLICY